MYLKKTYRYNGIIEVERVHSWRYGKRTPNGIKKLSTSEEQKEINARNAAKKLRRKIQANFSEGDLFETLTYKKDQRPDPGEARKRTTKLLRKLRKIWKQEGSELKYIIVTEYKNKSIHHHMILNDLSDGSGAKRVNQCWKENGGGHSQYLYEEGNYEKLADYLIKETDKTFRDPESPSKLRYSCSRNLIDPKPEVKIMKRDNWPEEPKAPRGYVLDKQSLYNGINKMGYKYQYYRLIRVVRNPMRVQHPIKSRCKSGDKKRSSLKVAKGGEKDVPD